MNLEGEVVVYDLDGDEVDRDFGFVTYDDPETGRQWITRTFGLEPGDRVVIDGSLSWSEPE